MPVPQRPRARHQAPTPVPPEPVPVPVITPVPDPEPTPEPEVEPVSEVQSEVEVEVEVPITRSFATVIEWEAWRATCATLGHEPKIFGVKDPQLDEAYRHWQLAKDNLRKAAYPDGPVMVTQEFQELVEAKTEELRAQPQL